MPTQDIVISACQWTFVFALFFSVFRRERMERTGPITAIGLTVISITFATMYYWQSCIASAVSALCWWVIGIRAVIRVRKENKQKIEALTKGKPWAL